MLSDLDQILYHVFNQGQTPCWKHILKFEPNLRTFYYTQKYEPSTKNEKVSYVEWIIASAWREVAGYFLKIH